MPVKASIVNVYLSTKPGMITDLFDAGSGGGDVILGTNKMPGQIAYGSGPATTWILRAAATPIVDETTWAAATLLGVFSAAGMTPNIAQTFRAIGVGGAGLYACIRCTDIHGTLGDPSNSVEVVV